jgi:hypothetical protein
MTAHKLLSPPSESSPGAQYRLITQRPETKTGAGTSMDENAGIRRRSSNDVLSLVGQPRRGSGNASIPFEERTVLSGSPTLSEQAASRLGSDDDGTSDDDAAPHDGTNSDVDLSEFDDEEVDLPKLLVYDVSLTIRGGSCNFFDVASHASSGAPTPAVFSARPEVQSVSSRKPASGWKPKAISPKIVADKGRIRLFSIPLPSLCVTAHQGKAETPDSNVDQPRGRSESMASSAMFSPANTVITHGTKPAVDVGVSNVVYVRVGVKPVDASPLLFVFLQQLVTEWQVRGGLSAV